MSENVLETLQKIVQDVIAPDLREVKVRLNSFESRVDERFSGVDLRFQSLEKQMEANTKTILAAIGELKAQSELATLQAVAHLRERVAVLESQRH